MWSLQEKKCAFFCLLIARHINFYPDNDAKRTFFTFSIKSDRQNDSLFERTEKTAKTTNWLPFNLILL